MGPNSAALGRAEAQSQREAGLGSRGAPVVWSEGGAPGPS